MPIILESTIAKTFVERQRQSPGQVGFRYRSDNAAVARPGTWKEVTFREFYQEAERVTLGLLARGFKKGQKAAILSQTRIEWAYCDFGIMGAQGISVPVYSSTISGDAVKLLQLSECSVAFVENTVQLEKIYPKLSELPQLQLIVVIDTDAAASIGNRQKVVTLIDLKESGDAIRTKNSGTFERNLLEIAPEDVLTICYTSGTTGVPKGVMLTFENLNSVLEDCDRTFRQFIRVDHEELLTFLPFSHIIGRLELMSTFVFGWKMNFAENIDALPQLFREVRPTIIFAVPRIFEKAYSHIAMNLRSSSVVQRRLFRWALDSGEKVYSRIWMGKKPSPLLKARYKMLKELILDRVSEGFGGRLRFAICGGAPLSREVGEYFQIVGIQILEGYGLTETFAPVALNTPENLRFGTVGKPLPDVEIRIADDGEICLRSKKVFKGYYKMPEETKQTFDQGWFLTGDIGFLDPDGYLHITDRKKDLIITSGGKNVAPQKVENLAKGLSPLIAEFVVIGERRKYLTALITLNRTALRKFADDRHVFYSDVAELTHNAKVIAQIEEVVAELNRQLSQFETIKKFMVLPGEFSVESGELTPSLKVKRSIVSRKFRSEIDQLYKDAEGALEAGLQPEP